VIAMLDCMSGALDGINSDGLAASLSFGGREEFGTGFGIPLVMRYLLEFAGNVAEARELLNRIPVHGAYNLTLLDADDRFDTIAIGPGQQPQSLGTVLATNHQPGSSWPIYEEKVATHLRYEHLSRIGEARQHNAYQFTREFLHPPLYSSKFARGFGTLYSAAFYPRHKSCEYFWPSHSWNFGFEKFRECEHRIDYIDPEGYPKKSQTYSEIYTGAPVPALTF
jgi:predicted choloylglycine hydrolase